ncbi:MAG: hypothetical protein H6835_08850 [Planctomycetes bacterium]|nr:hypothetical protein [Planctomycetota bacterium]
MLLFLVMSTIALGPYAIGLRVVREGVAEEISKNLRAPCHIGQLSFSWFRGLAIGELVIDNPPGYPTERPSIRLERAVADFGLGSLFSDRPQVSVTLEGLHVFVEQKADGSTNLQDLAPETTPKRSDPQSPESSPKPEPGSRPAPQELPQFAFVMKDCSVEVRRDGLLVEAMRALTVDAHSAGGTAPILVTAHTDLLAGELGVDAQIDGLGEAMTGKLVTKGLDLEKWRPLIDALMPEQLTALAGRIEGTVEMVTRGDRIDVGGDLEVLDAHVAGPAVQDMDLRGARWKITPKLALGGPDGDTDTSAFAIDLGFLTLQGAPSPGAGRAAFRYDLDVAALAEFGGPIPSLLKKTGSRISGDLQLPTKELPQDAAGWIAALAANVNIAVKKLDVEGLELRDIGIDVKLSNSACTIGTLDSSKLAGGKLSLQLQLGLADLDRLPTTATLQWRGGELNGATANLLRFAVPLLSGLDASNAQVDGGVNLTLSLKGPAMKGEQQDWLGWLDGWSGDGSVGLLDTTFRPAGDLKGLIEPLGQFSKGHSLGQDGKLRLDSFSAPFEVRKGTVQTTASEWLSKGEKVGLSGKVGFDGKVDYGIDLSQLLKGHKDGEKVLKALGGSLPKAKLTGTLDSPSLKLPELGDVAQKLLQQEGTDLLKKGLEDLFKKKKG